MTHGDLRIPKSINQHCPSDGREDLVKPDAKQDTLRLGEPEASIYVLPNQC